MELALIPIFHERSLLLFYIVPSPPLECTATITSSSNLVVFQWKEPADTNGQILAYHLFHETHAYVSQVNWKKMHGIPAL